VRCNFPFAGHPPGTSEIKPLFENCPSIPSDFPLREVSLTAGWRTRILTLSVGINFALKGHLSRFKEFH
jgi:hypothetical protein